MYDLHLPHLQKPKDKFSYNRKKNKKQRWNILRGNQPTITVFRKKSFATLHRIRAGSPAELRDVLLAETYLGR